VRTPDHPDAVAAARYHLERAARLCETIGAKYPDEPTDCSGPEAARECAKSIRELFLLDHQNTIAPEHLTRDLRQAAVYKWVCETFGPQNAGVMERVRRFFEEATELAQAEGLTTEQVHAIVSHVYGKPPGDAPQEVGGIGTTLLAYCAAKGISADKFEAAEFARVLATAPEHFRRRHDLKADAGIAQRTERGPLIEKDVLR